MTDQPLLPPYPARQATKPKRVPRVSRHKARNIKRAHLARHGLSPAPETPKKS